MKTTEEETKQSPSEEGEAKEDKTSTPAEDTSNKPAAEDVKAEEKKEEPTPNPSQEGKGGEDKKDQDTDTSTSTSAEAMADKKATADKPAEKEEAKEEEDTPKKKLWNTDVVIRKINRLHEKNSRLLERPNYTTLQPEKNIKEIFNKVFLQENAGFPPARE